MAQTHVEPDFHDDVRTWDGVTVALASAAAVAVVLILVLAFFPSLAF
jgi:hypothetical protein